jgi:putative transposase
LRPFLEEGITLARVARERGLVLRTARRWVDRYRRQRPAGLARKERCDKDRPRFSAALRRAIEGLALQKPHRSAAAIHRQAVALAEVLGEPPPSYGFVYALTRRLDPALMTLAHDGSKAYADAFDLVHRHEATGPNAVHGSDFTSRHLEQVAADLKIRLINSGV